MLWFIVALLIIFYGFGLFFHILGGAIHIVLVLAVILFVYNLIAGRRA
ncbi:MAG: lmo0937 family membrane protein [Janthinobacterium lividum]